jgi:HEPN domain-containing protein
MSAPDEPSPVSVEAERGAEAKRWLAIAQDDLEVSLAARNLPQPRAGIAAYHLQQAAEKVFKAMLVLSGRRLRRTHDLDELAEELAPLYADWRERLDALRPLTVWGIAYRYPGAEDEPEPEPDIAELEQAAALIRQILGDVGALCDSD